MGLLKKTIQFLLESNVYIATAALLYTLQAQIELGMPVQLHPYLFLIFFATLFEYNVSRLITLLTRGDQLISPKYRWVLHNRYLFYGISAVSLVGFLVAAWQAQPRVLLFLAPAGVLTFFYTFPFYRRNRRNITLRSLPTFKIFLIALVWSTTTVVLPVIQSAGSFHLPHLLWIITLRFLFIFSLTLPFDIRDMASDRDAGTTTIPLLIGADAAWKLALSLQLIFLAGVCFTFAAPVAIPLACASVITRVCLASRRLRKLPGYHHLLLDGMILLQALLVIGWNIPR